jgi:hypothetical protein
MFEDVTLTKTLTICEMSTDKQIAVSSNLISKKHAAVMRFTITEIKQILRHSREYPLVGPPSPFTPNQGVHSTLATKYVKHFINCKQPLA